MNKELNKLGKKVVALHECSKKGMTKKGYAMFKEAMASLMTLEGNGCKSEVLEKAKAILAEYYDTYKTQIKKDTTRVIVEGKAEEAAKKAAAKAKKENCKQLETFYKEMMVTTKHLSDVIVDAKSDKGESISSTNWERIEFNAKQIKGIAEKIMAMAKFETQEEYLD